MSAWKPIDTVPRDGRMVLLYNAAHDEQAVMGWTDDVGMPDVFPEGCWTDAGSKNQAINLTVNGGYFQYWKPLDAPPLPGGSNARFISWSGTGDEMTREQLNTLHGLSMNGGRVSVGGLFRREEYAEMERNEWLAYRAGGITPYMELTREGRRALADEQRRYLARSSPVTPL